MTRPRLVAFVHCLVVLAAATGLAAPAADAPVRFDESMLHRPVDVRDFYMLRDARLAWVYEGRIQGRALDLISVLERAEDDGLGDEDYHLPLLRRLLHRDAVTSSELRAFEMLATDALVTFAAHLAGDRVEPDSVYRIYQPPRRRVDPVTCLSEAFDRGADVTAALECLRPDHEVYEGLRRALVRMRRVVAAGGWSPLPDSLLVRPGETSPVVPALRDRLALGGDLDTLVLGDVYDEALEVAVGRFQRRHGLPDDGVLGPATLAALNVPASVRAEQIALNLERARWLPRGTAARRIEVNIPDYRLEVIEDGESVLSLRAVVGKLSRPTPVLDGRLTTMVLNPYWNIPHKLAREDVLPKVRRDPAYLTERSIRVLDGWGPEAEELDPAAIDWSKLPSERLPFVMRQDPGPRNPLGRVKFLFWNDYNVFIHDTTARGKFAQQRRAYSSGCVRVEDPLALASYVMGWTEEEDSAAIDPVAVVPEAGRRDLETLLARSDEQVLRVPDPLPVLLMYQTAWQQDGELHFRDDVYGYDETLKTALARRASPGPDRTRVDVDEAGAGIPTDTAALQRPRGATELSQLDPGHP